MDHLFHINILTLDKTVYEGTISSLQAPGEAGYLGVLANHIPLVTTLVPGNITIKDDRGEEKVFHSKGKGFLEVIRNDATILLDSSV
ncbi:MAG: F0F1 ATP synthase subunit epsilon [Candidatus Omnitrophota bacterium]|jgi:F-type H+-transporting ATPase subunit epsilon